MCFSGLLLCACTWQDCLSQAAITVSLPLGAPHEGGAPLAPFRYITDWEDPGGGGGMALEGGQTLLAHDGPDARCLRYRAGRRRGRAPRLPGDGPSRHLGVPGGGEGLAPPSGDQRRGGAAAAAAAPSRSGMSECPAEGGGRQLALGAPRADGRPFSNDGADDRKPPPASRIGSPTPQRRQGSGRTGCVSGCTGCRFLEWPSGGFWDAGGWRGCIPQYPSPKGSARRGVMGRPHGRRRCGSREGRRAGRSCSLGQPHHCIWCGHCGLPGGRPAPTPPPTRRLSIMP